MLFYVFHEILLSVSERSSSSAKLPGSTGDPVQSVRESGSTHFWIHLRPKIG